jgi:hypothetical protein
MNRRPDRSFPFALVVKPDIISRDQRNQDTVSSSELIHALMAEIGPILDLAEVCERPEEGVWALIDRKGAVLFLECAADDDKLWLSAEVGTPRPDDAARLYSLMLQYNAQWQQTGGVRLALDAPEGAIVQAYDTSIAGLDLPSLCSVIDGFQNILSGWRTIVESGGTDWNLPLPTASGVIRG